MRLFQLCYRQSSCIIFYHYYFKMTIILSAILLIFLNNVFISTALSNDDFKLELVQVLFRHGDRVADKEEIYKSDPYDEIFKKYGYGQLTTIGMKREFKIGQMLRERYDSFLGETVVDEIYARSTNYDRTKMSLQLTLAGMYRPSNKTLWNPEFVWTPVPTTFNLKAIDFLATTEACSRYEKLLIEAEFSPDLQQKMRKYDDFLEHLKNATEITIERPFLILYIYNNLRSALSLGLPLPNWCSEQDYQYLEEITGIAYEAMTHSETLRRMSAGPVIDQFAQNINSKDGKKIYLYSVHDLNIGTFLRTHNCTDYPLIPDYGSALIFEKLRGQDDQVYIRMLLWTGAGEKLIPLKVQNCDNECPLLKYLDLMSSVLPDDEVRKCTAIEKLCSNKSKTRAKKIDSDIRKPYYVFAGDDMYSFKYAKELFFDDS